MKKQGIVESDKMSLFCFFTFLTFLCFFNAKITHINARARERRQRQGVPDPHIAHGA